MTSVSHATQAGNAHGIVLLLCAVMPIMAITSLIPILPQLMRQFGDVPGSVAPVPIALTVPALCVALFSPLAGWLSDKLGRKRLLVTALVAYALIGFLPWFLDDLVLIIGAPVLLGVVEAIIMTVATALIGDYYEGDLRERWITIQVAISSIAATVLLVAGGVLGEASGSRGPFLLYLSSFGVALAALFILHEPQRQAEQDQPVAGQCGAVITALPLALITFGLGFAFYTIFVQIGPLLELTGSVTPALVGFAGAIINLGVVSGSIIFNRLAGRTGPVLLAIGLTATAAGYIGVALSTSFVGITMSATFACLGSGITLSNMLTWTMRSLPPAVRGVGSASGLDPSFWASLQHLWSLGGLVAPLGGLSAVIGAFAVVIAAFALVAAVAAGVKTRTMADSALCPLIKIAHLREPESDCASPINGA